MLGRSKYNTPYNVPSSILDVEIEVNPLVSFQYIFGLR